MKDFRLLMIILLLFPLLIVSCKTVELKATWDPNAEPDMSHYNLYSFDQGDYQKNNDDPILHPTTSYTFTMELPDNFEGALCFVVTAVDTSGNESDYLDIACVDE